MAANVTLTADDGHRFQALRCDPPDARGAIVLLHEIYGLGGFTRSTADRVMAAGYTVVVPALFDRVARDSLFETTVEGAARGVACRNALGWDAPLLDIAAARASVSGPVHVWGFSFGASLAWRAAASLPFSSAIAFSPGNLGDFIDEQPRCRTLVLFGAADPKTPQALRERVSPLPGVVAVTLEGGHAFYAPGRQGHAAASADVAWQRTMAFLEGR